jgi:hypothetical protein
MSNKEHRILLHWLVKFSLLLLLQLLHLLLLLLLLLPSPPPLPKSSRHIATRLYF